MVAILGYSRKQIIEAIEDMYTAVANRPAAPFHFPVGEPACRTLGYPPEQTATLPRSVLESFAGVGYPFHGKAVRPGDTVLDIGAGAGNDSLIAARLTGAAGRVIALDLTPAMTRKLKRAAGEHGVDNVSVIRGSAEQLPLADHSVDAITSNGALNLVPDKRRAVAEMFRVLRPGGRLQIADVVIGRPVTVNCDSDPRLWVECVVGATVEDELLHLFREAGFEAIERVRQFDYFAHSPSAQTREIAAGFRAYAVELSMRRGPRAPSRLRRWARRLNPWRLMLSLYRRGLTGVASLLMALIACYGTLAAVSLLPLLGLRPVLDEGTWAGGIALFTGATALAIGAGVRRHARPGPTALALTGAGTVLYALFVDYHLLVELTGFLLLVGATGWDLRLKHQAQARRLGLIDA